MPKKIIAITIAILIITGAIYGLLFSRNNSNQETQENQPEIQTLQLEENDQPESTFFVDLPVTDEKESELLQFKSNFDSSLDILDIPLEFTNTLDFFSLDVLEPPVGSFGYSDGSQYFVLDQEDNQLLALGNNIIFFDVENKFEEEIWIVFYITVPQGSPDELPFSRLYFVVGDQLFDRFEETPVNFVSDVNSTFELLAPYQIEKDIDKDFIISIEKAEENYQYILTFESGLTQTLDFRIPVENYLNN